MAVERRAARTVRRGAHGVGLEGPESGRVAGWEHAQRGIGEKMGGSVRRESFSMARPNTSSQKTHASSHVSLIVGKL